MYIKIRNAGSGETVMINNLSKLDNIGKVKALVTEKWVTDGLDLVLSQLCV